MKKKKSTKSEKTIIFKISRIHWQRVRFLAAKSHKGNMTQWFRDRVKEYWDAQK